MTGKWAGMIAKPMDELLTLDRDAFVFLNSLGNETWDVFWLTLTNKWTAIPLYVLLLYLIVRQWGWKRTFYVLIGVALLILATDQLANFFKYGLQRPRPCYDAELQELTRLVKASCGGKYSFYSAHASNAMAVAAYFFLALAPLRKSFGILLLIWAALVAYSRIYIGVHFPLDVLFGMGVGALMGWLFYKLTIFTLLKRGL